MEILDGQNQLIEDLGKNKIFGNKWARVSPLNVINVDMKSLSQVFMIEYGMLAVVDPYICKSCNNIVDVCVGEYGKTYTKEEVLQQKDKSEVELDFYECPECGFNTNWIKWNKSKRPCPKCDGKMENNLKSDVICWD